MYSFLSNIIYLKFLFILSSSLVIIYQLLLLYLLHLFSRRAQYENINIPPVLPDFLINFLNAIKILSSNSESIKELKNTCYIQIYIYLVLLILISFIL